MVKRIQHAVVSFVLSAFANVATAMSDGECLLKAYTGNGRTAACLIVLKENEFAFFTPTDPESFEEYGANSTDFFEDVSRFGYRSEIDAAFQDTVGRLPRSPMSFERFRKLSGINVKRILGRNVLKNCRVEFVNSENMILVYSNTKTMTENRRLPIRTDTDRLLVSDFELNAKKLALHINFGSGIDLRVPSNERYQILKDVGDQPKNLQIQISSDLTDVRFETDKLLRTVEFESMTIPNVCLSEGPATIGWGLLQRFDLALNLDDAPTMEILGSVNDHDCTQVLLGDFASNLEESGIRIGTIFSKYWSTNLKPHEKRYHPLVEESRAGMILGKEAEKCQDH